MNQNRIIWPDTAKGIGIILVVIGHAITYVESAGNTGGGVLAAEAWGTINKWIYSFHMPLFFFVSGYLQGFKEITGYRQRDVLKKLLSLAIPYLLFSVLYWLFKFLNNGNVNNPVTLRELVLIPIFPLSDMWFLYALLLMFLIRYICYRLKVNDIVYILSCVALSFAGAMIVWSPECANTVLPRLMKHMVFFSLGIVTSRRSGNTFPERYFGKNTPAAILFLMISIGFIIMGNVMEFPSVLAWIAGVMAALCGIFTVVLFSVHIHVSPIHVLGKDSMIVYLVHDYGVCAAVILLRTIIHSTTVLIMAAAVVGLIVSRVAILLSYKFSWIRSVFYPGRCIK